MKFIYLLIAIIAFPFIGLSQNDEKLTPPKAAIIPHFDTTHQDIRQDNYFWMRKKDSPEVINHLYAENGFADLTMQPHQLLQKKIFDELRGMRNEKATSLPNRSNGYYYYSKTEPDLNYPFYFRKKDTLDAKEELVLNVNEVSESYKYFSISAFTISPDNKTLAYGVDYNGGRKFSLFFKDLSTGGALTDTILDITNAVWSGDSKAVYYTIPEAKTQRSYRVYRHIMGTSVKNDELILEEKDATFEIGLDLSNSKDFVFINCTQTLATEIWVLDARNIAAIPRLIEPRKLNQRYSVSHYTGENFLIVTDADSAYNYKACFAPIANPSKKNWKTIVPHRKDVLLADVAFKTGDLLLLSEQFDAQNQLVILDLKTGKRRIVPASKNIGVAGIGGNYEWDESKFRYSYASKIEPSITADYDLITDSITILRKDTILNGFKTDNYIQERIYATATDGAQIPITLSYKKGLLKNGTNPCYLTGYGSYGNPSLPGFSSSALVMLNRGFVVATAHIRGGNDNGTLWYEDGKLMKKKNTFTDFIACAEKLISDNFTSKEKLAIQGGSAGGLLMGAVTNMRPDLFKCVVADVPFVDVINTMLDASIPLTTFEYDEWGNPNNKNAYDYMKSYSPYDNVEAKNYPIMLVTGGYNDSQVAYWEPAKYVAKLRALKTDTNLLLMKINMEAGHGGSSGKYDALKEAAFRTAFVMQALGIKEQYITVTGKTMDSAGNILPFTSVYVKGTTNGTTSNEDGNFQLNVLEPIGKVLVVQSLGFKNKEIKIDLTARLNNMQLKLETENYQLKTFEKNANAKDPAYAVMKKAIAARSKHLDDIKTYAADIYLKSNVRLVKVPKKLPGFLSKAQMPDSTDLGLIYLSESVAKYNFQAPDKIKEEMIASKVSGEKQGFSWNRVEDVLFNFYKNLVDMNYYSERGFVSPIAESAMFYYQYEMLGTFMENGKTINKIKLTPRRKNDPCFRGDIYIVEDSWNIHSLDLYLTKDAQIQYVDTLRFSQSYVSINDTTWMPFNMKMSSRIQIFGFEATDMSVGVFSNYLVNKPFPKKYFGNQVFKVEELAAKKVEPYWVETRPLTLTDEERKNYQKNDSINVIKESKVYKDSVDKVLNKFGLDDLLIGGYSFRNTYKRKYFNTSSLVQMVQFNTVEGLVINPKFNYVKYDSLERRWILNANLRHGFSDNQFKYKAGILRLYDNYNRAFWSVSGGSFINQINNEEPISPFINSFYTLIDRLNYMKLYRVNYGRLIWGRELINGVNFQSRLQYADRLPVENNSNYSFISETKRPYLENGALSKNFQNNINRTQALTIDANFTIVFDQKYQSRPNQKIVEGSKYPTLYVGYKAAIKGIAGTDVAYQHLSIGIGDKLRLGLFGDLNYDVQAGYFFGKSGMEFVDYKHFDGNQTFFRQNAPNTEVIRNGRSRLTAFQTLSYYDFSTNREYLEAHVEHNFYGWLINKIPLIRKTKFYTVAGANFLYTVGNKNFTEFYVGIDNILNVFRIDFVAPFVPGQSLKPQIRIGAKF